jgi:hypothetical protein
MSRVDEMEEMYVKRIVMLAQEIETEDPIDWGMLNISEDNAYNLIALNVVNQFNKYKENERDIMIATITKLVVENFALNLKIQEGKNNVNA